MDGATGSLFHGVLLFGQAAANDGPITDDDGALIQDVGRRPLRPASMTMPMRRRPTCAPTSRPPRSKVVNCLTTQAAPMPHAALTGPRGPLPVYSDLLLHDMGLDLADGLVQGEAGGEEFRTQPLWGMPPWGRTCTTGAPPPSTKPSKCTVAKASAAPTTTTASPTPTSKSSAFQADRHRRLLLPDQPIPAVGEYGGPVRELSTTELAAFENGRDASTSSLVCPTAGALATTATVLPLSPSSAAPARGVNVVRHGTIDGSGDLNPEVGTILHRVNSNTETLNLPKKKPTFVLYSTPSPAWADRRHPRGQHHRQRRSRRPKR